MAETTEATAHTGAEGAGGGLPQFEFQHWGGQIGYLLILFVLLYVLMSRVFVPRLRKVVEEREATISGAIASARQVQSEADAQGEAARKALEDARANAQRLAADAKAKAAGEAKARQDALEAELSEKLAAAEARIKASRDKAMASVADVATDTAGAIVAKLTGAPASAADVKAAVTNLAKG